MAWCVLPDGFAEAYAHYVEQGWNAISGPVEFGGQGLPFTLSCNVLENLGTANMAFNLLPMLSVGAIESLEHHGSKELQEKYLPKLVSGEWSGDDEPDRTAGRIGRRRAAHHGRADRRGRTCGQVPHQGSEDLHHLGRARAVEEHHPPRSRAAPRRARGQPRDLALHRTQVSREERWLSRPAQRSALR